jgi:hypothetical protein
VSEEKTPSSPTQPAWQCQARAFDAADAAPLDQLYVGDPYLLLCEGEFVEGMSAGGLVLQPVRPELSYGIQILSIRSVDGKSLWAEATSYKPGPQKFADFKLVSGAITLPLQGGELTVQSVLAQKSPEEMNHPDAMKMVYLGPFALAMPLWYWLLWGAVVLVSIGIVARFFLKRLQRHKILEALTKQATALTPYNQFNKELRQHLRDFSVPEIWKTRGEEALLLLDKSFRMYLLRELLVPANEWSTGAVMRDIRLRHKKLYRNLGPQLRRTLIELDRAKRDIQAISFEDCEQLRMMSRRTVDQLYRMKRLS